MNRPAFSKAVESGLSTPAYQPFSAGLWAYNPALEGQFTYDPDKARALLAEAGYADGFTFTIPSIPIFASRLEAVAGFLKDVGITMNIQTIEPGTLARRSRTTDFPATNLVWNTFADPKFLTTYYIGENAVFNSFKIAPSPEMAALSDKGLSLVKPAERATVYHELFEHLVDDSTLIFLTTTPLLFGATDAVANNATTKFRPGTDTPYFRGIRVAN
ncbi:MAG: peptide/nickel transport system substrate-binding protein [Paracoccaceae bacterium]|jgi:peptide/nickel transport system substrate-binding protein